MTHTLRPVLAFILLAFLGAGFALYIGRLHRAERNTTAFFSSALNTANISETVALGTRRYGVRSGKVFSEDGKPVSLQETRRALETAYALALAKRSPILGIPGTDPAILRQAASDLEETLSALARAQGNPADAARIFSLYPTGFLSTLAALEERRLAFLSSGAEADARAYDNALETALRAEDLDASNFNDALTQVTSAQHARFPGFGGTVTTRAMHTTLADTRQDITRDEERLQEREQCLSGDVVWCDASDLKTPDIPTTLAASPNAPAYAVSIQALFARAYGKTGTNLRDLVALDKSACLSDLQGPYYFFPAVRAGAGRRTPVLSYRGNLFFRSTDENGPVDRYQQQIGLSYSPVNPVIFYLCPDVGLDIGAAYAVADISAFARAHFSLVPAARARLFNPKGTIYEHDALAYLASARSQIAERPTPYAPGTAQILEGLALEYQLRTGGLGILAEDIAQIDANDLRLRARGVPFDVSAGTLFLTHSAFPSLLRSASFHRLAGSDPEATAAFLSSIKTYAALQQELPPARVLADLRGYLKFEERILDTAHASVASASTTNTYQRTVGALILWWNSHASNN